MVLVVLWLPHFSFESSPWDELILLAAMSFGAAVAAAFTQDGMHAVLWTLKR